MKSLNRLAIPPDLRPYLNNKSELRTALGGERAKALKLLSGAIVELQAKIGMAELERAKATSPKFNALGYPMTPISPLQARQLIERFGRDR